jgi:nitroreductase
MDVFDAIRSRRSHRAFKRDPVEPEKLEQILEAAQWAPSPANNQPWEFIVISGDTGRKQLVELSEKARKAGSIELHGYSFVRPVTLSADKSEGPLEKDPFTNYSLSFLKNVPIMIAVVGNPNPTIRQAGVERVKDGYKYACAAAIQNMLLAAQAQGLGSLWFTFFDRELLSSFLNIDSGKHLVAIVCIGYPATVPPSPGRLPLKTKVRRIG